MSAKYTYEMLVDLVVEVDSYAALCRRVGIKPFTGAQTNLRNRVRAFNIDTSHFLGQAHARGKKLQAKVPIEAYLVKDSRAKSHYLRLRLIREGLKAAQCEQCCRTEWQGEPIPLELDHINSDHWDCRLANLQILCPNCHAQVTRERRDRVRKP